MLIQLILNVLEASGASINVPPVLVSYTTFQLSVPGTCRRVGVAVGVDDLMRYRQSLQFFNIKKLQFEIRNGLCLHQDFLVRPD